MGLQQLQRLDHDLTAGCQYSRNHYAISRRTRAVTDSSFWPASESASAHSTAPALVAWISCSKRQILQLSLKMSLSKTANLYARAKKSVQQVASGRSVTRSSYRLRQSVVSAACATASPVLLAASLVQLAQHWSLLIRHCCGLMAATSCKLSQNWDQSGHS